MVTQRQIAVVTMKRRRIVVDLTPRYWAIGLGVGRPNVHVQLGPIGIALLKRNEC